LQEQPSKRQCIEPETEAQELQQESINHPQLGLVPFNGANRNASGNQNSFCSESKSHSLEQISSFVASEATPESWLTLASDPQTVSFAHMVSVVNGTLQDERSLLTSCWQHLIPNCERTVLTWKVIVLSLSVQRIYYTCSHERLLLEHCWDLIQLPTKPLLSCIRHKRSTLSQAISFL
jgi:hypothetical protein